MKHAREDYNRIQDPAGLIPDDEPVFLLRGSDPAAPDAVRSWADTAEALGSKPDIVALARAHADAMEDWQTERGSHVPDLP